jgi:hypothetical protein
MVKYLFLFLSVIASSSFANPIDAKAAKKIAESFIMDKQVLKSNYKRSKIVDSPSLTLAYSYKDDEINHPVCYVFNMPDDRGFIVTAGDDCVNSVLGYTNSGSFNGEDIPEGLS